MIFATSSKLCFYIFHLMFYLFWLIYHLVAILGLAVGGTSLMLHFIINVKKVYLNQQIQTIIMEECKKGDKEPLLRSSLIIHRTFGPVWVVYQWQEVSFISWINMIIIFMTIIIMAINMIVISIIMVIVTIIMNISGLLLLIIWIKVYGRFIQIRLALNCLKHSL